MCIPPTMWTRARARSEGQPLGSPRLGRTWILPLLPLLAWRIADGQQACAKRRRQENLDHARAALGDEQLQQAYAGGMALSHDQALDLALRKAHSA